MEDDKRPGSKNPADSISNLKTCKRCGRMFPYRGFGHLYCPYCKKKDDAEFERVKDYIYEHGVATAIEVSEMTGISLKQIEQYLRDGRLEIPQSSPIFIKCEGCKGDIRSGRFCPDCASKLSRQMKEALGFDEYQIGEPPQIKKTGKMRFFSRDDK